MQNRPVRVILVVLVMVALGGAGCQVYRLEQARTAARLAEDDTDRRIEGLRISVRDLQAAAAACVARGQDEDFWLARVATLADAIDRSLLAATNVAIDGAAIEALNGVGTVLASFRNLETRVRQHVQSGQHLLASDLIFADGLEMAGVMDRRLEEARAAEHSARRRREAGVRRFEISVLAGAAGVALLVALLLVPAGLPGVRAAAVPVSPEQPPEREASAGRHPGMRDLQALERVSGQPEPAGTRPGSGRAATVAAGGPGSPAAVEGQPGRLTFQTDGDDTADREASGSGTPGRLTGGPPAGWPGPDARPPAERAPGTGDRTPNLADAARLCADLARVAEAQELPGLLRRAATLLGASGIIVWVQNARGTELVPAVSHGYAPHVMGRMRSIARDADNATAEAYRAGELRVVTGDGSSKGAIVTPLVTPAGPVGVMAAEVEPDSETSPALQAIATIVAAQLATLIPAPPATT